MKRYGKEFKEQVLRLSDDIGVKKAAEQKEGGLFTYIFVQMHKRMFPVRQICKSLSVSECGYYKFMTVEKVLNIILI